MEKKTSQFYTLKQIVKNCIPNTLLINRLPKHASRSILFTFDDGPHKTITPIVLELLKEHQITAIFFVIGHKVKKCPHLLEMIMNQGHFIGNHSYEHPRGPLPSFFAYKNDILKCQQMVKSTIGLDMVFFRPPRGVLSPKTLFAAKSCNLITVKWSNQGGEWDKRSSFDSSDIAKILLETIKPRDIVLLHDDCPKVPEILNEILPIIKKRNFELIDGVRYLLPK